MKKSVLLLMLLVVAAMPMQARGKKSSSTAPGTYKEWGPDIDKIEIVKTFRFSDYRNVVVEPFDTSAAKLPNKDDNSYEDARMTLAASTEGFAQGLRANLGHKVSIGEGGNEPGTLIIRGKVT
ncbi:MAG: hypothetical protein JOZ54_18990, partial [Acidobacteria bacterium]|nr:hypothetical protein [Acidobacteriota bacterium]